jgi:hypothetical protein
MHGFSGPVPDGMWTALRDEFGLPSLEEVRFRLGVLPDPEALQQALIRVFIGDGTFCPGFQFLPGGHLDPLVTALFEAALEAKVPHNYFALWMMTPARELSGTRPVDCLADTGRLRQLLRAAAGPPPERRR